MRVVAIIAALVCAVPTWAQSLADLVRADRQQAKPHASKVITNDNLHEVATNIVASEPSATVAEEPADGLPPDLHRMRVILRNICADPKTESGRNLSYNDKKAMNEGVNALRLRVEEFERIDKKAKQALIALDKDFEAKITNAVNTGHPFDEADLQRVKAIWLEHDTRHAAVIRQGEQEMENYKTFQQQVEAVGGECPAAAASVSD